MTLQEQMQVTLQQSGIPAKEIRVYGSQIVITAYSRQAAQRWASLLARFAKVRGIVESRDYAKKNTNTVLRPSTVNVWRIGATL